MRTRVILLLLIAALYAGIVVSNNRIAEDLRKQVAGCMLPPGTELVDSAAVAGRLQGNGNGMQYFGVALIHSDLDEGPLRTWYEAQLPKEEYIWVTRRESELFDSSTRLFKDYEDDGHYWFVMLSRYNPIGKDATLLDGLRDIDIRGH